jgi:Protein of unknown function (DUF3435)
MSSCWVFSFGAFKNISVDGPVVDCLENLSSLGVVNGLGAQQLKLKEEILDRYVFCQSIWEADGFRPALDQQLSSTTVRYRFRQGARSPGLSRSRNYTAFGMGWPKHLIIAVSVSYHVPLLLASLANKYLAGQRM